jgi:hypothetical protein
LSNVTVTSTQAQAGYDQSLTVVAFSTSAGVGASQTANSATGAPVVSVITTNINSLVFAVGNDEDRAAPRTVGSAQTMVHQFVDTASARTFWVQMTTFPVPAAALNTRLYDTSPTTDRWNFAAVEIMGR